MKRGRSGVYAPPHILAKKDGKSASKTINATIHLGQLNRQIARFQGIAETLFQTALKREQTPQSPKNHIECCSQQSGRAVSRNRALWRERCLL